GLGHKAQARIDVRRLGVAEPGDETRLKVLSAADPDPLLPPVDFVPEPREELGRGARFEPPIVENHGTSVREEKAASHGPEHPTGAPPAPCQADFSLRMPTQAA